MIGRLNHVAIAVRDIAKAADVYRRRARRQRVGAGAAARAWRDHRVHHAAQHQDRADLTARRRTRRSRNFSSACPTAASITSATRSTTSSPRAMRCAAGRARARRRRAEDRRARQAGAVPASEGFLRHADRDRAGVAIEIENFRKDRLACPQKVAARRAKPRAAHLNANVVYSVDGLDGGSGISIRRTATGR